jgi:hypothetical protein
VITLEDALANGQGIERPFNCPDHDDHEASASVNVIKQVWYCFACNARGRTDGKKNKTPSLALLEAMLKPEEGPRVYSSLYWEQFRRLRGHWNTRFPDWLIWAAGLGHDPLTSDAVFMVHTPKGQFAGVGRRLHTPNPERPKQRYDYPWRWSAATSMGAVGYPQDVVVIVEGKGDATAVGEVGAYARCAYGSALHLPQRELIRRMAPRLVLLGFDADLAGAKGAVESAKLLAKDNIEIGWVDWSLLDPSHHDPADCDPQERTDILLKTVSGTRYGATRELDRAWWEATQRLQNDYRRREQ